MDWPASSPDLNPIKYVWDVLEMNNETRFSLPKIIQGLKIALLGD